MNSSVYQLAPEAMYPDPYTLQSMSPDEVSSFSQALASGQPFSSASEYTAGLDDVRKLLSDQNEYSQAASDLEWERSKEAAQTAREFTAGREDLAWQRSMQAASTAYQATVADMRAAGLNPYMMYASGGSASSMPSYSAASATSASVPHQTLDTSTLANTYASLVSSSRSLKSSQISALSRVFSALIRGVTS